jgi:CheY-like chemotaxis protein
VEDDDANRTILGEFLRSRGYEVDEAASGAEALVRAAAGSPDLVVLDIQLPGMDGFEVLARLRAGGGPVPPVLALTALAMSGDRERILDAGADAYLAKPAPLAALDVEIERLLLQSRR